MYISGIVGFLFSIQLSDSNQMNTDEKKYLRIFSIIFFLLGGIGVIFDVLFEPDWSPTQEILRCCKCKKKNDTSGCDVQSAPASQTVTEV